MTNINVGATHFINSAETTANLLNASGDVISLNPNRHFDATLSNEATAEVNTLTVPEQIRLDKDMARIREVLSETSSAAAQKILKEKWRVFIFDGYDEDHIAFVLRAGLKNANSSILDRALKGDVFAKKPFKDAVSHHPDIVANVLQNATPNDLEKYIPGFVLNEMLAERLKNIPARDLVNMLAEGQRLGYKHDDILDESDESVVPNVEEVSPGPTPMPMSMPMPVRQIPQPPIQHFQPSTQNFQPQMYQGSPMPNPSLAPSNRDLLLVEQERRLALQDKEKIRAAEAKRTEYNAKANAKAQARANKAGIPSVSSIPPPGPPSQLRCPLCKVILPTQSGYEYHMKRKPCTDGKPTDGKWNCSNCMSEFIGKQGMDYHKLRGVCTEGANISTPEAGVPEFHQAIRGTHNTLPSSSANTPILPPKPSLHSAQQQSTPSVSSNKAQHSSPAGQRPPLHTPKSTPTVPTPSSSEVRVAPEDLPPAVKAELDAKLATEEARYQMMRAEVQASNLTGTELRNKLFSIKNSATTRKSVLRRAYGVTLRVKDQAKSRSATTQQTPSVKKSRLSEHHEPESGSGTSTPAAPASGFSPINAPNGSSSRQSPVNGLRGSPAIKRQRTASDGAFLPNHVSPHFNGSGANFAVVIKGGSGTKESAYTIVDSSSDEAGIPSKSNSNGSAVATAGTVRDIVLFVLQILKAPGSQALLYE